jgi:hypothetical protein
MDARTKRVSLDFMGEGWNECFVEMRYVTWADSKKMIAADDNEDFIAGMVDRIRQVFVSGQVLSDGKPTELTREAIGDFDIEALKVLNSAALGFTDPKE